MMKDFYYWMHLCEDEGIEIDETMERKLRQIVAMDHRKEKRRKKQKKELNEKYGIDFVSLYDDFAPASEEERRKNRGLPSFRDDVEELAINNVLLEELDRLLDSMDKEKKDFLLLRFTVGLRVGSGMLGISKSTYGRKIKALIDELRGEFFFGKH